MKMHLAALSLILLTLCLSDRAQATTSPAHDRLPFSIGYLGASNDTATTNEILYLLKDGLRNMPAVYDPHVVSRTNNKCDVGEAIHHLFDLLNSLEEEILTLVVFGCTEVLKVVGEFAPTVNLTVLGLGSSSAVLKNQVKYPTLQLLSEVENTHSAMRVSFVENIGWRRVATIAEDYEDFTLAAENFYEETKGLNTSVRVNQSVTVASSLDDISRKVNILRDADLRIIFMFGAQKMLENILLVMARTEFFETRRVLVTNQDISRVPAAVKELFYIGYASSQGVRSSSREEHSSIMHSLLNQLRSFLLQLPVDRLDQKKLKMAFNKEFTYHGNFTSSLYRYNPKADMDTNHMFELLTTSNDKDRQMKVTSNILWPDGNRPLDGKVRVDDYNEISGTVLCLFCALSITASLIALVFLVINCKYRHVGLIKMSSPKLNYFNIAGAVCLYAYISVMGFSHPKITERAHQWMCTLRNLLLCGGYSFVFGPMCAKAYRVYYIFNSSMHGKISRKKLKDRNLLLFTGSLVLFDIAFIVSWHLIDPFTVRHTILLAPEKSDLDKDVYLHYITCSSKYLSKWLGIVYAYKGMLLIWGVYLAWTTRNVSIPTLNDSKSIMINIYVVLLASIILVIVSEFLQNKPTLSYSIVGCLILLSTTIMLGVLFGPKVVSLWKMADGIANNQHADSQVVLGMGFVNSSNTRRLEPDCTQEIRELELQSTILQSELRKLDEEIARLEEMVNSPSIQISDFITENLLFLLPLPNWEDNSYKLMRRNTPKYRVRKQRQTEWVCKELQRRQNSSMSLETDPISGVSFADATDSIEGNTCTPMESITADTNIYADKKDKAAVCEEGYIASVTPSADMLCQ